MARVLVTGATGFIGPHLVARLIDAGDEVTCLVRATSNRSALEKFGVRFAVGDVTDSASLAAAVAGQQVIYHLAGLTMALAKADLWRINEEGAHYVAAACARQASPPALVIVSSIAAAGPAPTSSPRTESDPLAPVSHYGRSKLGGEFAAALFADRVPTTIVRPPIVFGQGDRASLPIFAGVRRFGVHMTPSWQDAPFSFIHAADLAEAIVAAAARGRRLPKELADEGATLSEGVYFAAADEIVSYADFGRHVGRALGRSRTLVVHNLAPIVWASALGSEVVAQVRRQPMIFNLDKAREARAGSWTCSAAALARDTGFRPRKSLDERLAETAEWYEAEGWLPKPGLLARMWA